MQPCVQYRESAPTLNGTFELHSGAYHVLAWIKGFYCASLSPSLTLSSFKVGAMSHFSLVVLCPGNLWGVSGNHGQGRVSVRGVRGGSVAWVTGEPLVCERSKAAA